MNWIIVMVGVGLGVCLAGMLGEWLAWRRERRAEQVPAQQPQPATKTPLTQWCILVPVNLEDEGQTAKVLTGLQLCHMLVGWPKPHLICLVVDDSLPPDHPPIIDTAIPLKKE